MNLCIARKSELELFVSKLAWSTRPARPDVGSSGLLSEQPARSQSLSSEHTVPETQEWIAQKINCFFFEFLFEKFRKSIQFSLVSLNSNSPAKSLSEASKHTLLGTSAALNFSYIVRALWKLFGEKILLYQRGISNGDSITSLHC